MQSFAMNALHVMLEALCEHVCPNQVDQEHWELHERTHTVWLGPVVARGLRELPPVLLPPDALDTLRALLGTRPLHDELAWFRLYHAHIAEAPPIMEVLVDNQPWPEAQEALAPLDWPSDAAFVSVRLFGIIRREARRWEPDEIEAASALCALDGDRPDMEGVLDEMAARGLSPDRAAELAVFFPEAFAHLKWSDQVPGLPTHGVERRPDGTTSEPTPLLDHPTFALALRVAERLRAAPGWARRRDRVARWSTIERCICQTQEEGATLSGLTMGPLVFERVQAVEAPAPPPPPPAPQAQPQPQESPSATPPVGWLRRLWRALGGS